jgi:hypothetical protein
MEPGHLAGILLVVGATLFIFAASLPQLYSAWTGDQATYLATIAAHPTAWLVCHVCMTAAVLLTAAGLGLLAVQLAQPFAVAAAFAYAAGAAVWCVFEMYRLSVPPHIARAVTVPLPDWFLPLQDWSGRLFAVYMLTAYLSLAAFGVAILAGATLPPWSGWLALVFGLAGAVGLASGQPRIRGVSPFEPPVMIHLVPLTLGVLLLLQG